MSLTTTERSDPEPAGPLPDAARGPRGRRGDRMAVAVGAFVGAAVTFVLAVPRLGDAPLWLDEAYSLGVTNQFLEGVRGSGGTMVGYYAVLWGWTRLGDSPAWLRLLSTLFAMAAMVPLAFVARRIGGRRLAVLAPPLLAGAFMFQNVALEARAYTLEIVLVVVCWGLVIGLVQDDLDPVRRRRRIVALAVLGPIGVTVHGLFVLFVAAMAAAVLVGPRPRSHLRDLIPMLATTALATGGLAMLGLTHVGNWIAPTTGEELRATFEAYTGGTGVVHLVSVAAIVGMILWALAAGAARRGDPPGRPAARRKVWLVAVPVLWLVIPPALLIALSEIRPRFVDRYLVAVTPAVALLVGLGLIRAVDWAVRRLRAPAVAGPVALVLLGATLATGWAAVGQTGMNDQPVAEWDDLVATVSDRLEPGDGLLLYSDWSRPPFEAAWSRGGRVGELDLVNMDRPLGHPRRYDDVLRLDDDVAHRIEAHDRIWTVSIRNDELAAAVYELSGPLPDGYRIADTWDYDMLTGPATLRLYVRDPTAG